VELIQRVEVITLLIVLFGIVIFGVVQCFFGYRIFKFTLKFIGFLLGAVLAGSLGIAISQEGAIGFLAAIIGGFIGAALMVALHFVGIFLIGALFGGLIGALLSALAQSNPEPAVLLMLAVIGGIIALKFHKFMIIISTAFCGSWIAVTGLSIFNRWLFYFTSGQIYNIDGSLEELFRSWGSNLFAMVLSWLALGIAGVIVQYRSAPMENKEAQPTVVTNEEKEESSPEAVN